ncbi:MAG: carboxypeptidase-like regulatory domain-containing protein [Bacteroidales bacterium]|nr:carboxypeptidase-like regulatory domain-containing protein [Bacteroidales bacterium]
MLTVLVLLMAVQVFAQKSTITGVVKNIDGMPIVGAAVQEKGLTNSTITDPEGKFSLQVYDGKALIVKMKGYYTQVIKLEEGTVNLGEIVLVEIHRWEFGVLAGSNNTTGDNRHFRDIYGRVGRNWHIVGPEYWRIEYEDTHLELNVGAYIFFNPCKATARIQTLIGLGLSYYSKQISCLAAVRDIDWNNREWESFYDFKFKQTINTIDIPFLIKHKVRVKKSGICLLYGPVYGVIINDNYKLNFGEYSETIYDGDGNIVSESNDFSKSISGVTEDEIKREFNQVFGYKYVLGGVGGIGFEHSSGFGIWGTYTVKCYRNQYDEWALRNPTIGGVLSYRF